MGQRNISYSNHIVDLGADQRSQEYIHPEPCMLYGSFTAFPHPGVHVIAPAPRNTGNFYLHHVPDHQDANLIYGMSPSNGVQQQHPATSSNHYNPYVAAPSASTDFSVPVNHDRLPFPGTTYVDNYNLHMNSIRGSFKQKDAEGPDTVLQNNNNHLLRTNYVGQAYQFPGNPWLDMPFNSSGSVPETWAWNQAAPLPYPPGGVAGSASFLHPPIPQGPSNHHLPPNLQGHNMSFVPQMPASSRRHLRNSLSNSTDNPFQGVIEGGSRYTGPFPPTGFRLYQPYRREFMLETNTRHRNLPNMRVLPEDEVAMLDVPGYHDVGNAVDQHRDMRLDVDHMSYEELLALGEQIGNVRTGLSEEVIVSNLKTRICLSSKTPCTLESATFFDHKTDFCVICQTDYKGQEKIGILECGHEYHEECVKKWLVVKNTCPVCKSTALSTRQKDL